MKNLPKILLRIILPSAIALSALSLTSCGTVQGFGKDLQKLGGKMEGTSKRVESGGSDKPESGGRY